MAPQKAKGQKMALGDFLTDTSLGSWADEMEDMPLPASGRPGFGDRSFTSGPGYGSAQSYTDRGFSTREELPLPSKPPFTVHLGNMSFDATEGDIQDFFSDCSVTSVRIVEDKMDRKPKGFGYAEFASLEGLKKALELNQTQFQGRNLRVTVAEPQKDRPDAREFNDWTRKGPLPDIGGQRRVSDRPGFGSGAPRGGGFDNVSEAGSERGGRRGYEMSRDGSKSGDGKVRDFANWDRKGPLTPTLPTGPAARSFDRPVSRDGPLKERRNSPAWGEGRSQEGSRPPRREFVERPPPVDRAPTAPELDSQWRTKMKPDAPAPSPVPSARSPALSQRETSGPPSPAAAPAAPASRPRLNLQKRTVSEAPSEASPSASDSKVSPFGAAKPIDTAGKEKEIEEKRQIALREKKEADDKAREEKKIADDKAREEKKVTKEAERAARAERADKEPAPEVKTNGQKQDKENGVTSPTGGKNYEILRRAADEDATAADESAETEDANGAIVDDKAIKPKEIVRDIQDTETKANGASIDAETSAQPSADALEDDGWSTVPAKVKPRPNRNKSGSMPAARALAS